MDYGVLNPYFYVKPSDARIEQADIFLFPFFPLAKYQELHMTIYPRQFLVKKILTNHSVM